MAAGGRAQRGQPRSAGQRAEGEPAEMMSRFRDGPGAELLDGGVCPSVCQDVSWSMYARLCACVRACVRVCVSLWGRSDW